MRVFNIKNLIVLIGLALLVPVPVTLIAPDLAGSAFGIPVFTAESQAYLLALAVRDMALGVWLLSMVALDANKRILAVSLWSIGIVAAGDALNVGAFSRGQNLFALVPHVGGVLVLGAAGWRLWRAKPMATN